MSHSRKDPMWKTLEGVLYTLDKVSYMVDNPVKPIIKPEPKPKPKFAEKSPILPRNTGINRGKLMRQLEESEYGIALRDDTLRRELREVIKYDCSNEAIEDFCQPSIAEKRFKYENYKDDYRELPPVCIPEVGEFVKIDSSQFDDAEILQNDETTEESSLAYQSYKVKEPIIKPMNSLFRNRVDLKCRNALILNLKKEQNIAEGLKG